MAKKAARKTAEIKPIIDRANRMLAMPESDINNYSARMAVCWMLDSILLDTGNYLGFQYQASEFANDDHTLLKRDHDDSRRIYLGGSR